MTKSTEYFITDEEFELTIKTEQFEYRSELLELTGALNDPHLAIHIDHYSFVPNDQVRIKI
ncbi:hypothetical protein GCM10011352_11770 [Marinobacterium zhoushanense]|uniref:CYTH domain-containing protein n=1 Tax=Marinobacterium zhoushanense TaxID=1679163 RepID=A0ABQ1K450_9GAMM|nr:hypothetical protein GCM10011352_11770 [Marinobacterium zhoushanense]